MKKKEINKISKKVFKKLNKSLSQSTPQNKYLTEPDASEPASFKLSAKEEKFSCQYNEEVSNKFKNLFNNIIKYPENIRISYNESFINIEIGDIKYIKKAYPPSNGNMIKSSGNGNMSIYIHKDKYFSLTLGYNIQTSYTDVNMYNELIDITKDKVSEINANNFNNIWENISKESGILRDFNLDEILK